MTPLEESTGSATRAASGSPPAGSLVAATDDHAQQTGFSDPTAWKRLSDAESTAAFAAAWLELQCQLIGSVRTAVVVLGPTENGAFQPLAYWPEGSAGNPSLVGVAELAMAERRGAVRQQKDGQGQVSDGLDAFAYPLMIGETLRGVVAVEVVHEGDARLHVVMRLLQWGCAWWTQRLGSAEAPNSELTTVLELLATGLQEKRFVAAATAVATELATLLHCERVSIGIRKGRHTQVRALSHTANFNKKSSLIRALGSAMDEAIDQQETLVLPRSEQALPLITQSHDELMEQHGSRAVCSIPLSDAGRMIGALTLERAGDQAFSDDEVRLCAHAATLIGPVLEGKRREDRWIGIKLWDALGEFAGHLLGAGHLALKTSALALLVLIPFLFIATGEYRLSAPAVLEGTVQRAVTAPLDGYIASAEVRAGDLVSEGQTLAALEDKDLRLEKVQWEGEREKYRREYSKALAERDRARVRILGAQIEQAEARVALLSEQLGRTRLRAPFAGMVVSGDLSQSLGAPVSRGDVLFEIAPLDSYRVMLQVDERDISQVRVGQTGALALAGLPGEPLRIQVEKITPVAMAEAGQNLFRVEAALLSGSKLRPSHSPSANPSELSESQLSESQLGPSEALRPGMQGIAKIDVEQRNLFWIWTHKLVYWVRLWWWSWWP